MKERNEVVENLEEKIEEDREDVQSQVDEKNEELKEGTAEVEENSEAEVSEKEEEIAEDTEEVESDISTQIKNLKKHDAAQLLVTKAKFIVKDAEDQLAECKLLLASDLKEYENAKHELKANGMDACEELLSTLNYVAEEHEEISLEEDVVVFEPKAEVAPLYVQDVSSGKFTGFIMSLIAGAATLGGLVYFATEKLGVTLDLSKVPVPETIKPVFGYFGTLVGMNDNANVGMALIAVVTLLVMWIVYAIRVSTKGSANLHKATEQLAAAEEYTLHKSSCKDEMDKVDAYIHDAIKTLKKYQVIFNEQKGKLERILYIEESKIETAEYHHKSLIEMKDTNGLITVIKEFMSVPMSEEGKLSGKSSLFLHRAESRIQKVLDRLY